MQTLSTSINISPKPLWRILAICQYSQGGGLGSEQVEELSFESPARYGREVSLEKAAAVAL